MSDVLSLDPLIAGNVLLDIVPHSFEVDFGGLSPEALLLCCRRRARGGVSAHVQWVVNAKDATSPAFPLARAEHECKASGPERASAA